MKSKIFGSLLIFLALWSCQKKEKEDLKSLQDKDSLQTTINKDSLRTEKLSENEVPKVFTDDFLKIENAQVNGNDIVLSQEQFQKLYSKHDSIKSEAWDCGSPFEWLDKKWMEKTYGKDLMSFDGKITTFYAGNAEFISNNHKVIFSSAKSGNNRFEIRSHHIILTNSTTVAEFQKLFPKLKIEDTDQKNVQSFSIPVGKETEDSFMFYFKDGKLDNFNLWWLLC
ncbi:MULTISPECIES: hypothetical protein [unclassified Chryseobacterium]|uniref:hypothetical protein n=1 Tax=unclassified Chryseobacterium TaxID=2593645 RepID=UPI00301733FD